MHGVRPAISAMRKTPDVVFYTRQLHNGGVDRVVFNLAQEFLRRGLKSAILVDRHNPYSPFKGLIPPGIAYVVLDAEGPLARFVKLRRYLRRTRPRAVMCTSFGFPNLFAVAVRRLPGARFNLMLTEHCTPSASVRASPRGSAGFWFFRFARLLYPFADSIVAVSRGTAKDLADVLSLRLDRIATIYNPIITDELLAQAQEPVDHPWFAEDTPVVIGVGRLEEAKNFALLIRAFAQVRAKRPCRLMILGDGTLREDLQQLIASLGLEADIAMPGFVANPHAFVHRAAVMVLSSDFESFGNVIIEAVAVDTPVIATDCPDGPVEVLGGGAYGRLVPMGDEDAMAQAILDVIENPPAKVPAEWLDQFTAARSADVYLEHLKIAHA